MGCLASAEGRSDGIRPVGGDHQNPAARQAPAEMEEEADRTGVGPLHIIQEQEQRVIACQELQDTRDLFKEIGLLEGGLLVSSVRHPVAAATG